MAKNKDKNKAYWSAVLKLLIIILAIWAVVAFLLSIIFVDALNAANIGGYPLGFWFAQQGSIYIFVILIFVYTAIFSRIDKKYDAQDVDGEDANGGNGKS